MQTGLLMVPGQGIVNRLGRVGAKKQFVVGSQLQNQMAHAGVQRLLLLIVFGENGEAHAKL